MLEGGSCKAFRCLSAALVIAAMAVLAPASAQFPPAPDDPQDRPPVGTPKKKAQTPAGGPSIAGTWAGQLTQIGSQTPYNFEIAITARGGDTKYPDLDCAGKLTRMGSSKSYLFFVEVITKGQAEKGGRCPDGTITVGRAGNDLAVGWFGSIQDSVVVAYGLLKKK
jgi:hypothetical protein